LVLNKFKEKYQKTFFLIKNLKAGKSEEELVKMGYYCAHIRRLKKIDMSKVKNLKTEVRRGFVYVSMPDSWPLLVTGGAK